MAGGARESWIWWLLFCRQVMSEITGPTQLTYFVGETAHFRWTNTDENATILSATWGIKKGNIANPQFINIDILSNKTHLNSKLEPSFMARLSFEGDLKKGLAWFCLKYVTINDTNEYLASISVNVKSVLPYTVVLTVKEREEKVVTTKEPDKKKVIPSTFLKAVETSTKAPKKPVRFDGYKPILFAIGVLVPAIFFAFAIAIIVKKKPLCVKNNMASSETKPMKV